MPFFSVHFQFILILFTMPMRLCKMCIPAVVSSLIFVFQLCFVFVWNTLETAFYSCDLICGAHTRARICTLTCSAFNMGSAHMHSNGSLTNKYELDIAHVLLLLLLLLFSLFNLFLFVVQFGMQTHTHPYIREHIRYILERDAIKFLAVLFSYCKFSEK